MRSYSREDDHRHFIAQLCGIMAAEHPDALLVSGDVYDNPVPTIAAQNTFVKSMLHLHAASPRTAIIVTGGNHDSGIRLDVHRPVWEAHNVTIIGSDTRPAPGNDFDLGQFIVSLPGIGIVAAVPYYHRYNYPILDDNCPREHRQADFFKALMNYVDSINADGLPVIVMAHLTVSGCDASSHESITIGGEDSIPARSLGDGADYIALGHIHKPQWITSDSSMARYCGSPYPMTFAEDYEHSVTIIELNRHGDKPLTKVVPLHSLHRLVTLPEQPGTIEDAFSALQSLEAGEQTFVRLQVLRSEKLPADADMRASKVAEMMNYRFCNFLVVDDLPDEETSSHKTMSLEEINKTSPLEIAKLFYQNTISKDMPQEYIDMLSDLIAEVDRAMPDTKAQP